MHCLLQRIKTQSSHPSVMYKASYPDEFNPHRLQLQMLPYPTRCPSEEPTIDTTHDTCRYDTYSPYNLGGGSIINGYGATAGPSRIQPHAEAVSYQSSGPVFPPWSSEALHHDPERRPPYGDAAGSPHSYLHPEFAAKDSYDFRGLGNTQLSGGPTQAVYPFIPQGALQWVEAQASHPAYVPP